MRVLVIAYEIDDDSPVLAWQAQVVRHLAQRCEFVVALADRVGVAPMPANVWLEPLAAHPGMGSVGRRLGRLRQVWRLCRAHRVQAVFVHMAHRYAYLFYPIYRWLGLPVLLWYAHGTVTWHLRLAHWCADRVISSSPDGFRIASRKAHFIGQGIDTERFAVPSADSRRGLICVGRVSRRKRLELLLDMMRVLDDDDLTLTLVGSALTPDDVAYELALKDKAAHTGVRVHFAGASPMRELPALYGRAALHINVSHTHSMDKTVLESLACGCPVLTTNPAFRQTFQDFPQLIAHDDTPDNLARQVREALAYPWPAASLRALVVGKHDLNTYIASVLEHLHALSA